MKSRILNALRSENGVVSGEALSQALGVSRVSVWKHIQQLRDYGYPITGTAKGYHLKEPFDALFPWEFDGRESRIHFFETATSTMEIAKEMAHADCPHFTVVIAGRQEMGRGRLRRVWLSDEGGLYFTMVLRPQVPSALATRVNFLAALVLAQTLRRLYGIDAKVKWPNDILVEGKKISGMLAEMEVESDLAVFINIGIGINVNNDPSGREPRATSLKKIFGKEFSRKKLLGVFLDAFEARLESLSLDEVIPEWKRHSVTLGLPVKIVTMRETIEGVATDVDENGALILKQPNGTLKKVVSGDCFH